MKYVSLWALAYKLGTYPDLLRGLCRFHSIDTEVRGRAQCVSEENAKLVECMLWAWRSRPKVDALLARRPRSRVKKKRAARTRAIPIRRI